VAGKSDEKWLALTASHPVAKEARVALKARMATVVKRLDPVAAAADPDPEDVHQLRVATRRAAAVLKAFAPVLSNRKRKAARDRIGTLRRTAGGVRDWDVFLWTVAADGRLAEYAAARTYLLGYAAGRRADALDRLRTTCADPHDLTVAVESVRKAVRAENGTVDRLGAEVLGTLFDEINRTLASRPELPNDFHRLRIADKRLRYAIEVFAGCFDPALRTTIYPLTVEGQQILGRMQDAAVAADRVARIAASLPPAAKAGVAPGLQALLAGLRSDAAGREAADDWAERWRKALAAHPLEKLLTPRTGED
jgi:CHAD domain-containing protein